MDRARDLPGRLARTAARLERAGVTVSLGRAIPHEAVLMDARSGNGEIAIIQLQVLAPRADIDVALVIEAELGPREAVRTTTGVVEHGDVRLNALLMHQ